MIINKYKLFSITYYINRNKKFKIKFGIKNFSSEKEQDLNEKDIVSNARIRLRNLHLTYSNIEDLDITREYFLNELLKKTKISKYVIAKELHKNGIPHFHIVLSFTKQLNKPMDFFDITALNREKAYHPNIQYAKPLWKKVLYAIKEDKEYLVKGFSIEQFIKMEEEALKGDLIIQSLSIFREEGYNKALDFFIENSTDKQRAKHTSRLINILKNLENIKNRLPLPKAVYGIDSFYKLVGVEDFFKFFSKTSGHGTLFLGGITGIGKTHYFEALFTAMNYKWVTVGSFEELKKHDLKVDFIIFDDVNFKSYKTHEDFLKLFEHLRPTAIPCRHYDPIIPVGVGRVFLSNLSFFEILERVGLEKNQAIIRRVYDAVIIHYLSPKIKIIEDAKAIVYHITINNNIENSNVLIGNDQLDPRKIELPIFNSIKGQIKDIPSFAKNQVLKLKP